MKIILFVLYLLDAYGMISMTFLAHRGVVELMKENAIYVFCIIYYTGNRYVTFSVFPMLSSYISHRIWHYGARSGLHIFLFFFFWFSP